MRIRHPFHVSALALFLVAAMALAPGCKKKKAGEPTAEPGKAAPASREAPAADEGLYKGEVKIGHVVGVCMSCMFFAHIQKYFPEEGITSKPVWTPHPSDAITMLDNGKLQFVHGPFTAAVQGAAKGAKIKIIAGSGNHGLWVLAQPHLKIKSIEDLKAYKGKGLKVGSQRMNTLELTFYGLISDAGMTYKDFDMKFAFDHFSMMAAFENKEVDVITHVEPYATMLEKKGAVRIGDSTQTWGEGSPDCVVSVKEEFLAKHPQTVKRYLRAILRADRFIKSDMEKAAEIVYSGGFYKVDKESYKAALPRQLPGVDLRKGVKGMNKAIGHLVELGYMKAAPKDLLDLSLLEEVIKEQEATGEEKKPEPADEEKKAEPADEEKKPEPADEEKKDEPADEPKKDEPAAKK